jgi:hypothetical protein
MGVAFLATLSVLIRPGRGWKLWWVTLVVIVPVLPFMLAIGALFASDMRRPKQLTLFFSAATWTTGLAYMTSVAFAPTLGWGQVAMLWALPCSVSLALAFRAFFLDAAAENPLYGVLGVADA